MPVTPASAYINHKTDFILRYIYIKSRLVDIYLHQLLVMIHVPVTLNPYQFSMLVKNLLILQTAITVSLNR